MMSSPPTHFLDFTVSNALHLLGIFVLALLCIRILRAATNKLVKPANAQTKASQSREQQTRIVADQAYSTGCKLVWIAAALTALPEFGIAATPALVITGVAILALSISARNRIQDVIAGFQILVEDQFLPGDTIQVGHTTGRVEDLSLRRTLVRDARGALVSISNREMRIVGNLSRDWSQAFVDIGVGRDIPMERALRALETAAAELRSDAAWSQALIDGPRVLGVQSYDRNASVVRVQVRTLPMRQEEISRELRRRIQLAFQKEDIPLTGTLRVEMTNSQAKDAAPDSPQSN